jgi:hypothetical protein
VEAPNRAIAQALAAWCSPDRAGRSVAMVACWSRCVPTFLPGQTEGSPVRERGWANSSSLESPLPATLAPSSAAARRIQFAVPRKTVETRLQIAVQRNRARERRRWLR